MSDAASSNLKIIGTAARQATRVEQRKAPLLAVDLERRLSAWKAIAGVLQICAETSAPRLRITITAMCIHTIITITTTIIMMCLKRAQARIT
jgi:hypothetical protein